MMLCHVTLKYKEKDTTVVKKKLIGKIIIKDVPARIFQKQIFLFKSTSRNINVTPESKKKILKSIRKKTLISKPQGTTNGQQTSYQQRNIFRALRESNC